jgi:hypothetical protein
VDGRHLSQRTERVRTRWGANCAERLDVSWAILESEKTAILQVEG